MVYSGYGQMEESMFQWHDNTIETMMVQSVSMEKTLRWNEGYDVILQFQSVLFQFKEDSKE